MTPNLHNTQTIPELTITHLAAVAVGSPVAQALIKTGASNLGIARLARHHVLPLGISQVTRIHHLVRGVPQRREVRAVNDFAPADAACDTGDVVAGGPRAAGDRLVGQVVDQRPADGGEGLVSVAAFGHGVAAALVKRLA